jgi:hypothetical protein
MPAEAALAVETSSSAATAMLSTHDPQAGHEITSSGAAAVAAQVLPRTGKVFAAAEGTDASAGRVAGLSRSRGPGPLGMGPWQPLANHRPPVLGDHAGLWSWWRVIPVGVLAGLPGQLDRPAGVRGGLDPTKAPAGAGAFVMSPCYRHVGPAATQGCGWGWNGGPLLRGGGCP